MKWYLYGWVRAQSLYKNDFNIHDEMCTYIYNREVPYCPVRAAWGGSCMVMLARSRDVSAEGKLYSIWIWIAFRWFGVKNDEGAIALSEKGGKRLWHKCGEDRGEEEGEESCEMQEKDSGFCVSVSGWFSMIGWRSSIEDTGDEEDEEENEEEEDGL
jgi:hypothetical protein